tara:strand:+ start:82 stop:546 length:465 start_codon:yes stop_codon:yes gene_type:complete
MIVTIKNNRFYFILLSLLITFTDQFTKNIIYINHNSLINNNFIIFSIDYVKNYGAAFNIFSGSRIPLSSISTIITFVLVYLILYKKNISILDLFSYSFILGGTIGNGIDRILKGYVIDFINLNFINFAVFNIADVSINIGLIFFVYGLFKNKRK